MCSFLYFCLFIQLHSPDAVISFPQLRKRVRVCVCARGYSLNQIPERMFMSLLICTRSFLYRCIEVEVVFLEAAVPSSAARWQCCSSLRPKGKSVHAWRICYHKSGLISIQHFIVLLLTPELPLYINSIQVWKIVSLQLEREQF